MKKCAFCNSEFKPRTKTHKFCQPACNWKARSDAKIRGRNGIAKRHGFKTCKRCRQQKPTSEYPKSGKGSTLCAKCRRTPPNYAVVHMSADWKVPQHELTGLEAEMATCAASACYECKHYQVCRDVVKRLQVDPFYNGEIRCMVRL